MCGSLMDISVFPRCAILYLLCVPQRVILEALYPELAQELDLQLATISCDSAAFLWSWPLSWLLPNKELSESPSPLLEWLRSALWVNTTEV